MRKSTRYFVLGILLFAGYSLLRSHIFFSSLSHDEGLFLYAGQAWAHGEVPYRDFWDHKPPGTFFFHSIPLRLFPFSLVAIRLHEIFWLTISALFLFDLCRRYVHRTTAILVLLFYLFYTSMPFTIRSGGLTEENALWAVWLSAWLILHPKLRLPWKSLLAGITIGMAIQFRQTFVFTALFSAGVILHSAWQTSNRFRSMLQGFSALAMGMLIPEGMISLYFFLHGAWFEYFEASYLFNFYYIGPGHSSKGFADTLLLQWNFLLHTGPYLFAPAFALAVIEWVPVSLRWMILPLLCTFAGDALSISLSGEYYEHYYVQAALSIHLCLALFLEGLFHGFQNAYRTKHASGSSYAVLMYLALLLIAFMIPIGWSFHRYLADYRDVLRNQNLAEGEYRMQQDVSHAVNELTLPDERILLIGRAPNSVYFLARRYSGSRFYHYSPLWKEKLLNAVTEAHEQAFLDDLSVKRPVLILLDRRVSRLLNDQRALFRHIKNFLDERYIPLEEVSHEIPEDRWFWYGPGLTFWVRRGMEPEFQDRLSRLIHE